MDTHKYILLPDYDFRIMLCFILCCILCFFFIKYYFVLRIILYGQWTVDTEKNLFSKIISGDWDIGKLLTKDMGALQTDLSLFSNSYLRKKLSQSSWLDQGTQEKRPHDTRRKREPEVRGLEIVPQIFRTVLVVVFFLQIPETIPSGLKCFPFSPIDKAYVIFDFYLGNELVV